MAIVAKMLANEVQQFGGYRLVRCHPTDDNARPVEDNDPKWLRTLDWHVRPELGLVTERIRLNAVHSTDPGDPNRDWSLASPTGELTLSIQNPEAMGYIKPGREYRVTIEQIRGPRDKDIDPEYEG